MVRASRLSHPVLVAEEERECALGLSQSLVRRAPRTTIRWKSRSTWPRRAVEGETGKALLVALVEEARRLGHHALLARISADNTLSIAMHAAQGFVVVGTLREVGSSSAGCWTCASWRGWSETPDKAAGYIPAALVRHSHSPSFTFRSV